MPYHSISIKNAIQKVHHQQLLLPAIQRNFVWDSSRIENYFDSIMRGYPLGYFIWWKLDKSLAKKYPFYKFLSHYHQRDNTQNERAQENLFSNEMFGILDGQQRLSAIYLGISGSLTLKKKGRGHWKYDENFEELKLYINFFHSSRKLAENHEENPKKFGFKFISESAANQLDEKHLWVKVGDLYALDSLDDKDEFLVEMKSRVAASRKAEIIQKFENTQESISLLLEDLYKKFIDEDLLSFFEVCEKNLDEVLNIFVRVNSGGVTLTKSQLMLATLAGAWEQARDNVEKLVKKLRNQGLYIDNDFVMRAALMLSDLPVLFKVGTFTNKNVDKLQHNWSLIDNSLTQTVKFLNEQGFLRNVSDVVSKNAILPIAYYVSKNGDLKSAKAKVELNKYFIVSQIKGVFGSQGDSVLTKVRDSMRKELEKGISYELKEIIFAYKSLESISFSGTKSFKIEEDFIEGLMTLEYGRPQSFYLLTLLYPNIDYEKILLDVDHIHPKSKFTDVELKKIGITDQKEIEEWGRLMNYLPNLQLLTFKANNTKRAKSLEQYLVYIDPSNSGKRKAFITDNFLPDTEYALSNFRKFFEARRKTMIKKLTKILS
ncbi:MAG: DUF262 domain-containing protein [Mucilaginibacter polytrichastri]|nr:DUF262 domain-containing protein [Mucilaginibacter polytrichastri]